MRLPEQRRQLPRWRDFVLPELLAYPLEVERWHLVSLYLSEEAESLSYGAGTVAVGKTA